MLTVIFSGADTLDARPLADKTLTEQFPAFTAEAILSWQHLRPDSQVPVREFEARLQFSYSNGWWEIEREFLTPAELAGTVVNVKRIPDGTRSYGFRRGDQGADTIAIPPATAHVLPFPNPLSRDLLLSWLALCPFPELPVLNSARMRRFSSLAVFEHPDNTGNYVAEYLKPGAAFLSRLEIIDNGIIFTGSDKRKVRRPAPFDKGMIECVYQVTRSTNYAGIAFPVEATLTFFSTTADRSSDVPAYKRYPILTALIDVQRLDVNAAPFAEERAVPPRLFAFDYRPPGLPSDLAIEYVVTNDAWLPADDHTLTVRARVARSRAGVGATTTATAVNPWFLVLLLLMAFFPAILIFRWKNRTEKGD